MNGKLQHIGLVLGVWTFVFAPIWVAVPFFKAPWWVWAILGLWTICAFVALLISTTQTRRARLQTILGDRTYRQAYATVVVRPMRRLWRRFGRPAAHGTWMFPRAFTWRLYDLALLIAVAYPILLLTLPWLLAGSDIVLADIPLRRGSEGVWDIWPERAAVLGAILILVVAIFVRNRLRLRGNTVLTEVADWAYIGLGLGLFFLVSNIAGTGVFPIAAMLVFTGTNFTTGVGIFLGAAAIALSTAAASLFGDSTLKMFIFILVICSLIAGVAGSTLEDLQKSGRRKLTLLLTTLAIPALWVATVRVIDHDLLNNNSLMLFFFLGVFPLINALFDTVSYAATLSLVRWGIRSPHKITGFLAGLADLVVAMVLFAALTVTLTATVAALNRLAGVPLLDLDSLLRDLGDASPEDLWVFLMIASTLVPTLLHFGASLLALQSLTPARGVAVRLLDRADTDPVAAIAAPLVAGMCLGFPLFMGGLVLWAGIALLMPVLPMFGDWYLDQLLRLADAVRGSF